MVLRLLLTAAAAATVSATQAQTIATFESLPLVGSDTAYINFTTPGKDVGFDDGLAHFPCVYDTGYGSQFWSGGFAYSNNTDTVTGGFAAQYNARPGKGVGSSKQYAIYFEPYDHSTAPKLRLKNAAAGRSVQGFYITNTMYAYTSMKNGDGFMGPRFGDSTSTDTVHARPDFLKLTVRGYAAGVLKTDSVEFYLADFRSSKRANDYIVRDWTWFSLLPLGKVDSLDFFISSSRNNSFGNLAPSYFAMDNFATDETNTGVTNPDYAALLVYPNPATDRLFVEDHSNSLQYITAMDVTGKTIASMPATGAKTELNTAAWPAGVYLLRLEGTSGVASLRIVKH